MKMKSLIVACMTSAIISGIIALSHQTSSERTSYYLLDNIEALSDGETGSCSAVANCYSEEYRDGRWQKILDGNVSCVGETSCSSGKGYVECDGKRSSCI